MWSSRLNVQIVDVSKLLLALIVDICLNLGWGN